MHTCRIRRDTTGLLPKPNMPNCTLPSALFLGIAERVAYIPDGNTNLRMWNALGLRSTVLSHVYPMPLPQWHVAMAIAPGAFSEPTNFSLVNDRGSEVGVIRIVSAVRQTDEGSTAQVETSRLLQIAERHWSLVFLPLAETKIVIDLPGTIDVRQDSATGKSVGSLSFFLIDPPPMTAERIAAIRSDPAATKSVKVEFGCKECDTKILAYAALDREPKFEANGWVWFANLPDRFRCTCGKTDFTLDIVRRNLQGLLGRPFAESDTLQFVPLYEKASLSLLRNSYSRLLSEARREEDLQNFLEQNPVLLHPFPALRLFSKPPILTEFFADFAIVTPQRELLLVEIETTTTRLLRKDGGHAAPLVHAFDQVRSWLHVVDEHLLAVLDSLKIDRTEVARVRGVVIAGRDLGYDALHLRRLKAQDFGRISFLTYDDLLFALDSLIGKMNKL